MHRLIWSLAITVLFVSSGVAQDQQDSRCRVRFTVVQKQDTGTFKVQPDDHDSWGQWPEDARQWWAKDGSRKFKELCEAGRSDADFVVAWEVDAITKRVSQKVGEQPRTMCGASDGCREWSVPIWEDRDVRLERLLVTLYLVARESEEFLPVLTLAKEKSPNRGISKETFENVLKTLRKEAKKNRRC